MPDITEADILSNRAQNAASEIIQLKRQIRFHEETLIALTKRVDQLAANMSYVRYYTP